MILIPRMKPFSKAACRAAGCEGKIFHTFTYFSPLSAPVPLLLLWLALPSRCFSADGVVRASPHEDPIPDTHPPLENIQSQGRASLTSECNSFDFCTFPKRAADPKIEQKTVSLPPPSLLCSATAPGRLRGGGCASATQGHPWLKGRRRPPSSCRGLGMRELLQGRAEVEP